MFHAMSNILRCLWNPSTKPFEAGFKSEKGQFILRYKDVHLMIVVVQVNMRESGIWCRKPVTEGLDVMTERASSQLATAELTLKIHFSRLLWKYLLVPWWR